MRSAPASTLNTFRHFALTAPVASASPSSDSRYTFPIAHRSPQAPHFIALAGPGAIANRSVGFRRTAARRTRRALHEVEDHVLVVAIDPPADEHHEQRRHNDSRPAEQVPGVSP